VLKESRHRVAYRKKLTKTKRLLLQGWLKGRNVTKGVSGLFPGHQYVQFISKSKRRNSVKVVASPPLPAEGRPFFFLFFTFLFFFLVTLSMISQQASSS